LIRVLMEISEKSTNVWTQGGPNVRQAFDARVKSLMTDVPDLPNFSHFHDAFRKDVGKTTNEGDIRGDSILPTMPPAGTSGLLIRKSTGG
jgi:arginine decarboxylase